MSTGRITNIFINLAVDDLTLVRRNMVSSNPERVIYFGLYFGFRSGKFENTSEKKNFV